MENLVQLKNNLKRVVLKSETGDGNVFALDCEGIEDFKRIKIQDLIPLINYCVKNNVYIELYENPTEPIQSKLMFRHLNSEEPIMYDGDMWLNEK